MSSGYLWLKAFHIVFVVAWFAGLFYLPRLFVNHAMVEDAATRERLIRLLDTGVVPAELAQVIRAQLAQIDIDAGPVASRPAEAGEAGGADAPPVKDEKMRNFNPELAG